jgi:signal transduction histidine kinase
MAMAGVATVDAGELGQWGIAVVSTAAAERDRERRASIRQALSVMLAGGVVLAFGSVALRRQRKQLELERELALAQLDRDRTERLVRASRAATMGTFAMGIAHEISTPLGVIVGRAEQLLARADDDRTRRGLQAIADQSEQIGSLVCAFMALARGGTPTLATVEPRVFVDSAVRMIEHRFATKSVTLTINMPIDLPSIHCDLRLIEHALINLLLNACEACDKGGHVELAVRSDGGPMAFVINDDGKGISREDAARATEPFFTTKTELGADGAGLGLAIVQEIAKSHRGSLSIAPRPGKGTRAAIELPIEHVSERP